MKVLLEKEGITEDVRKAFIVYLISSENPISHLLQPNSPKDFLKQFDSHFKGMTFLPTDDKELLEARRKLINKVNEVLT